MSILQTIADLFDSSEDKDFDESLGESYSRSEIEAFAKNASKHYANQRVLKLRSKILSFLAGAICISAVLGSVLLVPGVRSSVAEALFSAEDRLRHIITFLEQDTSQNESAENVKADLRNVLLDAEFQRAMVVNNLSNEPHEDIGFESFPRMADRDIWQALGKYNDDDELLEQAFDEDFIRYLRNRYSLDMRRAFLRAEEISKDEVKRVFYANGSTPEDASLRVIGSEYSRSQCGYAVDHSKLQVEIALPRDVLARWKQRLAYQYLQCRSRHIPQVKLTIISSTGIAEDVDLIGVVPSESQRQYTERIQLVESGILNMDSLINPAPVEVRVTTEVAKALGATGDFSNFSDLVTFQISESFNIPE